MNRKIQIIQDEENLELWHWCILEYNVMHRIWFNIAHGMEKSYEKACFKVKEMYDSF